MLSDDQVAAKQLEIDAALQAINRIGQTTSFGEQKLFVGDAQSDRNRTRSRSRLISRSTEIRFRS